MLTEKKQIIIDTVKAAVYNEIYNDFINLKKHVGGNDLDTLHNAIANGVAAGIKVALDHVYTTEEFEQDVGLK